MANDSSGPTEVRWPPVSAQYQAERDRLEPELRPTYDALVESYRFHAFVHHRQPFVSYKVLAALVRDGWRPTNHPPIDAPAAAERSTGADRGAGS